MWPPPWGQASGVSLMPWAPPTGGGYWQQEGCRCGDVRRDVVADVGTSSRRVVDAAGNVTDAVGISSSRRVRSGMI
jgi:hypothetical protein